jgi:putative oxidoreductase
MDNARWNRYEAIALTLLRVMAAMVFMQHGLQKLFGWFGGMGPQGGAVPMASLFGLAGVIELVGGTLITVGLGTRIVAFICSGEMAAAYFKGHAPHGFWPLVNHGEVPVLLCFLFLYLVARGAGPYSLDALLARKR